MAVSVAMMMPVPMVTVIMTVVVIMVTVMIVVVVMRVGHGRACSEPWRRRESIWPTGCQGACKPGSVVPTVSDIGPYRHGQPFL